MWAEIFIDTLGKFGLDPEREAEPQHYKGLSQPGTCL